jgi:hypothetical protein
MEVVLLSSDGSQHLCRDIECPAVKTPPLSVFRVKLMNAEGHSISPFFTLAYPSLSGNS